MFPLVQDFQLCSIAIPTAVSALGLITAVVNDGTNVSVTCTKM